MSERQLAANRANAQRSTGPRTAAGKARSSRNRTTHGMCRTFALAPGEDRATFDMCVREIEQELHPRTVLQRMLVPRIAQLAWNLRRFADANARLFEIEGEEWGEEGVGNGEWVESGDANVDCSPTSPLSTSPLPTSPPPPACEILARHFSDPRSSGAFARINRYERSMESALLRLIREYHRLQKTHPTAEHAPDEPPCPRQRAWVSPAEQDATLAAIEVKLAAQDQDGRPVTEPNPALAAAVARASAARAAHLAAEEQERRSTEYRRATYVNQAAAIRASRAERTHSNPSPPPAAGSETAICSTDDAAPVTERSHRETDDPVGTSTSVSAQDSRDADRSERVNAVDSGGPARGTGED